VTLLAPQLGFSERDTFAQARHRLASALANAGKEPASIDSRLLLEAATGLSSLELVARANDRLDPSAAERLQNLANRRLGNEPINRILGRSGFFGIDLLVTSDVLDPRADTEALVNSALDFVCARQIVRPRVLDLGTGSGAILCAILHSIPDAFGIGVDLSSAACEVARTNLKSLGLHERSTVICGNWGDSLSGRFDLVVSNPPYIADDERLILAPEVVDHDPHLALFGGGDGLCCYRQIARELSRLLKPGGGAFFEIGWRQARSVIEILSMEGFTNARGATDSGGRDRVVSVIAA
jgi:release factor glutamine methyltransferase